MSKPLLILIKQNGGQGSGRDGERHFGRESENDNELLAVRL